MKKIVILAVLLSAFLVVAGCGTGTRNSSKPQSQWGADHAECEKSIRKGLSESPEAYDASQEMRLIKICMQKKGWH
jgi:hypothetical protein